MRSRPWSILFALVLLTATAAAQGPVPERRVLAVSVLDKDGQPVEGLTPANFRGEFRGQPVKILSATPDTSPRRIVILIDLSASVKGRAGLVWGAARDVVHRLGTNNEVAMVTVAGEVQQVQPHLTNRSPEELAQLLSQAQAASSIGGGTVLYDGMVTAARLFPPGSFAGVLYVVSDGVDTQSHAGPDDVAFELARTGIRACIAWFRGEGPPLPLWFGRANQARKQVTELSGGMTVELRDEKPEAIAAQSHALYNAVNHVYRVEIEFPRPVDKPREWKLEVVGADGKKLKDVTVAYPRLLVPHKQN